MITYKYHWRATITASRLNQIADYMEYERAAEQLGSWLKQDTGAITNASVKLVKEKK